VYNKNQLLLKVHQTGETKSAEMLVERIF